MTEGRPFSFLSSLKASADGDECPLWVESGHWLSRATARCYGVAALNKRARIHEKRSF